MLEGRASGWPLQRIIPQRLTVPRRLAWCCRLLPLLVVAVNPPGYYYVASTVPSARACGPNEFSEGMKKQSTCECLRCMGAAKRA